MSEILTYIGVVIAGLYLVCLGLVAIAIPNLASHFLLRFARTAKAHFIELWIRLAIGCAFVLHSPHMNFQHLFWIFGWLLIMTTLVLLAIPWHWHQSFARLMVPHAVRQIMLVGVVSLSLGVFVITCAISRSLGG